MTAEKRGISQEQLEAIMRRTPFVEHLGARLESFDEGVVSLSLRLREQLQQHRGFAHGGIVAFMADSALAWAAASVAGEVLTAEFKINFVAPATGDLLMATGTVLKAGKSQVVVRADVYSKEGSTSKLVAVALGTLARSA